jgi:hypothetical protein
MTTSEMFDTTSSIRDVNIHESASTNVHGDITMDSTSSITFINDHADESNTRTIVQINSNVQDPCILDDETHLVEKIEAVRNDADGLTFRIKLLDDHTARWIPSKIANQKYPQAVIAFWEAHVEFD